MSRQYSKTCSTWKFFEAAFIQSGGKTSDGDWIQIPCETKGQAINLTQGMNACNRQYHTEQEIPLSFSDISARPVEVSPGVWVVAMGPSYAHRAKQNQKLEAMLKGLTEKISPITDSGSEAMQAPGFMHKDLNDPDGSKKQAKDEELYEKLLRGEK